MINFCSVFNSCRVISTFMKLCSQLISYNDPVPCLAIENFLFFRKSAPSLIGRLVSVFNCLWSFQIFCFYFTVQFRNKFSNTKWPKYIFTFGLSDCYFRRLHVSKVWNVWCVRAFHKQVHLYFGFSLIPGFTIQYLILIWVFDQ